MVQDVGDSISCAEEYGERLADYANRLPVLEEQVEEYKETVDMVEKGGNSLPELEEVLEGVAEKIASFYDIIYDLNNAKKEIACQNCAAEDLDIEEEVEAAYESFIENSRYEWQTRDVELRDDTLSQEDDEFAKIESRLYNEGGRIEEEAKDYGKDTVVANLETTLGIKIGEVLRKKDSPVKTGGIEMTEKITASGEKVRKNPRPFPHVSDQALNPRYISDAVEDVWRKPREEPHISDEGLKPVDITDAMENVRRRLNNEEMPDEDIRNSDSGKARSGDHGPRGIE